VPRHAAWTLLRSGRLTALREVDRVARARGLDARDTALLRRLVGTEVRRRGTLRALVQAFTRRKPSPDLAAHLRLGFVQLFFLDQVPPHAAVSETVRATADTLGPAKGRFANAVLREALRARREERSGDPRRDLVDREVSFERPVFRDPQAHPLLWAEDALSIPGALMKRWNKRYGDERAQALARTYMGEPDLSLRVVRGDADQACQALAQMGLDPRRGAHERVLLVPAAETSTVVHAAPFEAGEWTVQGETSLRAAELLGSADGERILDLCAAPGGKTTLLAEGGARVLAVDRSPRRLLRVVEAARRLGVLARVRCVASDGARVLRRIAFDAALVDVPCSNTGVLGARPEARWRFGPATQAALVELQGRLLGEAARLVRPGGRLVYSTCSIEPEENARQVQAFLDGAAGWTLAREHEALADAPGGPGPVDGGYAALLERS